MSQFLVLYLAPASVVEDWKKTEPAKRKESEQAMQRDWKTWMGDHARMFVDTGGGVGKTKRVAAQGVLDARNDIMLYAIVEAESHEAAAKALRVTRTCGSRRPASKSWSFTRCPGSPGSKATGRDRLADAGIRRSRMPRGSAPLACNFQCAVQRHGFPAGANPARQLSLQPVAIGAVVEVTKRLKPPV